MKKAVLALLLVFCMLLPVLASCDEATSVIDVAAIEEAIRNEVSTKSNESDTAPADTDGKKNSPDGNKDNGKEENKNPDNTEGDKENNKENQGGTGNTEIPEIPELDYGGKSVRILVRDDEKYREPLSVTDANVNNSLDEAIFKRNIYIEEALNIEVEYLFVYNTGTQAEYIQTAQTNFMIGEAFDVLSGAGCAMATLASQGILVDLNEIEYINLDADHWSQNAREQLTTPNGRLFMIDGDISYNRATDALCLFFNNDMLENYNLESPYELVEDGLWTFEKFASMVKDVYCDDNSDAVINIGDTFGFATSTMNAGLMAIYGTGVNSAKWDKVNSRYVLAWEDEKIYDAADRLVNLTSEPNTYLESNTASVRTEFLNGRVMFYADYFGYLSELTNNDVNVGVVPIPKYSADMDGYVTPTSRVTNMYAVCAGITDVDLPPLVLELFAAYGYAQINEIYYLQTATDASMADSMKLIADSMSYDLGAFVDTTPTDIVRMIASGNHMASAVANYKMKFSTEMTNWYASADAKG